MFTTFRRIALAAACMASSLSISQLSALFEVTGEYLFLKPTVDDTYFVINSPQTTAFPNGRRENNDPRFQSGFRVGVALDMRDCSDCCSGKWLANYTRLSDDQTRTIDGTFLWATLGRADFASNFENYAGSAASRMDYLYQRLDTLYSHEIETCCGMDYSVLFGLEAAQLRLTEDYSYVNGATTGLIHKKSTAWGVGPQVGMAVSYELFTDPFCIPGGIAFNVLSSGSLLTGQSYLQEQESLAGAPVLNVWDRHTTRVIPALHTRAGLSYELWGSCMSALIEVGYEFSSYFRALSRYSFPDDVADSLSYTHYYNHDFQGLYISATVRF